MRHIIYCQARASIEAAKGRNLGLERKLCAAGLGGRRAQAQRWQDGGPGRRSAEAGDNPGRAARSNGGIALVRWTTVCHPSDAVAAGRVAGVVSETTLTPVQIAVRNLGLILRKLFGIGPPGSL